MDIKIMSRSEIEKLLETQFPVGVDVISFSDTECDEKIDFRGLPERVFEITVDDLEFDELEEYGQGRSATAILEAVSREGITIFSDYRYYPNKLIYNKLSVLLL